MVVYIPAFESQRDQSAPLPWTNCQPASGAMLLDHWTYGRIDTTDIKLRALSGIPVTRGMNFAELSRAMQGIAADLGTLRYSERDGSGTAQMVWGALRTHLANGGAAIAAGNYSSLAAHKSIDGKALTRWQPGGAFGHAMLAVDYNPDTQTLLLLDPLGHSGYGGDRINIAALWDFIWRNGNGPDAIVTAAHSFSYRRPAPLTTPPPAPPVIDYAGKRTAFGTTFPSYVNTEREVIAWYERTIRNLISNGRIEGYK